MTALWVIIVLYTGADPTAGADLGAAGFLAQAADAYPTRAACDAALEAWQSSGGVTYVCVANGHAEQMSR
jgi:hypothetical protein